jgi:hypothetical protein
MIPLAIAATLLTALTLATITTARKSDRVLSSAAEVRL